MNINLLIIGGSLLLCLLIALGCWLYLNRTLSKISRIIHCYLTKQKPKDSDVAETREAKLVSQLRQLISISDHEARSAREEKEAVSQLVSDLSHQLKTPLANITMYTELLREDDLSEEEKQEFLVRTGEQAAKMEWLMNTLFKTSRLEIGMIEFQTAVHSIKETIAAAVSAVYGQAEGKGIRIGMEEFPDCRLLHNPRWTAEAISNLLENAIKYSPQDSVIRISLEQLEFYSRVNIIDRGIGIASEEYNLIFRRFYRSKQVEQVEGSGLGLYLAQLILAKEGGYITVSSELGKGSCFCVYLRNVRE